MEVVRKVINQIKMGHMTGRVTVHFDTSETCLEIMDELSLSEHTYVEVIGLNQILLGESDTNWTLDSSEDEWSCNEDTIEECRIVNVQPDLNHHSPQLLHPGLEIQPPIDEPDVPPQIDGNVPDMDPAINQLLEHLEGLMDKGYESGE